MYKNISKKYSYTLYLHLRKVTSGKLTRSLFRDVSITTIIFIAEKYYV